MPLCNFNVKNIRYHLQEYFKPASDNDALTQLIEPLL
jgi:hypothetical protein